MSTLVRQKYNGPASGALRRVVKRAGKFISNKSSHTQVVLRNNMEASEAYLKQLRKGIDGCKHVRLPAAYSSVAEIRERAGVSTWDGLNKKAAYYVNNERYEHILVYDVIKASIGATLGAGMIFGAGLAYSFNVNLGHLKEGPFVSNLYFAALGLVCVSRSVHWVLSDCRYQDFRLCQKLVKELDRQQPFARVDNPREYVSTIELSLNASLGELRTRFDTKWEQFQGWKKEFEKQIDEVKASDANIFGGESQKIHVLASLDHRFKEIASAMSEFKAECLDPLEKMRTDLLPAKMAEVEARVQKYEADLAEYHQEQELKKQREEMQAGLAKLGMPTDFSKVNKALRKPEFTIDDILSAFDDELDAFVDARSGFLKGSYGKPAGNGRLIQNGEVTLSSDANGALSLANKRQRQASVRP